MSADDLTMADVDAWIQGMPDSQPVDGGHERQPGHIAATAGVRREVELLAAAWAICGGTRMPFKRSRAGLPSTRTTRACIVIAGIVTSPFAASMMPWPISKKRRRSLKANPTK